MTAIIVASCVTYVIAGMATGRAAWRRNVRIQTAKHGQRWRQYDSAENDAMVGAWFTMIFWPFTWIGYLVWTLPVRIMTRDEDRGILPSWRGGSGGNQS